MPRAYEKYLKAPAAAGGGGRAPRAYEKYLTEPGAQQEAGPEDRQRIEYQGETYEGTPEQVGILRGTVKPSEERRQRFALSGSRPEGAGLSKMRRAKTTGEEIAEGGIRAGSMIALAPLGPLGVVAGGAAAENIIRDIDAATGQADVATPWQATGRGALEGGKVALLGAGAGQLGRLGKYAVGSVAPRLAEAGGVAGRVAGFTGGSAALEGRLPTREDVAQGTAMELGFTGAGKLARMGGKALEGAAARGRERAADREQVRILEQENAARGPMERLTPADRALFEEASGRIQQRGAIDPTLAERAAEARKAHEALIAEEYSDPLERPRSVGEEYRAMRGQSFPGGAMTAEGRFYPEVRGERPSEPPDFTAQARDKGGREYTVAWANRDEALAAGFSEPGNKYRGSQGLFLWTREPEGQWEIVKGAGRFSNEAQGIKALGDALGIPEPPKTPAPPPEYGSEAFGERFYPTKEKGAAERERKALNTLAMNFRRYEPKPEPRSLGTLEAESYSLNKEWEAAKARGDKEEMGQISTQLQELRTEMSRRKQLESKEGKKEQARKEAHREDIEQTLTKSTGKPFKIAEAPLAEKETLPEIPSPGRAKEVQAITRKAPEEAKPTEKIGKILASEKRRARKTYNELREQLKKTTDPGKRAALMKRMSETQLRGLKEAAKEAETGGGGGVRTGGVTPQKIHLKGVRMEAKLPPEEPPTGERTAFSKAAERAMEAENAKAKEKGEKEPYKPPERQPQPTKAEREKAGLPPYTTAREAAIARGIPGEEYDAGAAFNRARRAMRRGENVTEPQLKELMDRYEGMVNERVAREDAAKAEGAEKTPQLAEEPGTKKLELSKEESEKLGIPPPYPFPKMKYKAPTLDEEIAEERRAYEGGISEHTAGRFKAQVRKEIRGLPKGLNLEEQTERVADRLTTHADLPGYNKEQLLAATRRILKEQGTPGKEFLTFRDKAGDTMQVHPSTREPGKWQVTRFDKQGEPVGHANFKTRADAVASAQGQFAGGEPPYGGREYKPIETPGKPAGGAGGRRGGKKAPPAPPTGGGGPGGGGGGGKKPPPPEGPPPPPPPRRSEFAKQPGEEHFTKGHIGALRGARFMREQVKKYPPPGFQLHEYDNAQDIKKHIETFGESVFKVRTLKNATPENPNGTHRALRLTSKAPEGFKGFKKPGSKAAEKELHNLIGGFEVAEDGRYMRDPKGPDGYAYRTMHVDEPITIEGPNDARAYIPSEALVRQIEARGIKPLMHGAGGRPQPAPGEPRRQEPEQREPRLPSKPLTEGAGGRPAGAPPSTRAKPAPEQREPRLPSKPLPAGAGGKPEPAAERLGPRAKPEQREPPLPGEFRGERKTKPVEGGGGKPTKAPGRREVPPFEEQPLRGLRRALEGIGKGLGAPYRLEQKAMAKLEELSGLARRIENVEGGKELGRAFRIGGPLAIPYYRTPALAVRAAALLGEGAKRAARYKAPGPERRGYVPPRGKPAFAGAAIPFGAEKEGEARKKEARERAMKKLSRGR